MSARSAIAAITQRLRDLSPAGTAFERQAGAVAPLVDAAEAVTAALDELDREKRTPNETRARRALEARAKALRAVLKGIADGR